MSWIEGRLWSSTNPIKKSLRYELGFLSSQLAKSMKDFNHPYAHRTIKWDISKSLWVENHLDTFDSKKAQVLKKFIQELL